MPASIADRTCRLTIARLVLILSLVCFGPAPASDAVSPQKTLRVGVADCAPFVMTGNGEVSGLAVYLWEQVAAEFQWDWEYEEMSLGTLLEHINNGITDDEPDVGISCTSVTSEREQFIDFSHSFTETHTAIAVRETTLWSAVVGFLTSPTLLKAVAFVLAAAVVIGLVFFMLEGRRNKKLFSSESRIGQFIETIILGLMFVTNGPIRYYRFKTLTGRTLATMLTLSSTFLIAAVTAILASSFTLNAMQTDIRSLDDLRNIRVGALASSTSSALLSKNGVIHQTRPNLDELVMDLDHGRLDAVVSDAAFLQYRITKGQQQGQFKHLAVLPNELQPQNYAFVLEENSPLREPINRALLSIRTQREWREKNRQLLGE